MKRAPSIVSLLLTLVLTVSLAPRLGGEARGADYIAAHHTRDNGRPYYIMVNRTMNTVTVYGLDEAGYYTVPVKVMVCSVGRQGHGTIRGTFAITGVKKEWCLMLDGTYGQYSSQFSGYYLFHSVCYSKADPSTLLTEEYNMLGQPASLGCVRLQVADAKWIYDNCDKGTKVTVYDGEEAPAGKGVPLLEAIGSGEENGWEPTDPRPENPWHGLLVRDLALDVTDITLEAGMRQRLWPQVKYDGTVEPTVTWSVSDPTVASVDPVGRVTGLREGTAVVTALCGTKKASCTVRVKGELLHFTDVLPGTWYYSDVRYAYERGIFSGTGRTTFDPNGTMTVGAMAQVLYNMAGKPWVSADGRWDSAALQWAWTAGLLEDREGKTPLTRKEMTVMLYRFQTEYWKGSGGPQADLSRFPDGESLSGTDRLAMSWAVGNGLVQGNIDNLLDPEGLVPRAQAATILRRYHEMWGR